MPCCPPNSDYSSGTGKSPIWLALFGTLKGRVILSLCRNLIKLWIQRKKKNLSKTTSLLMTAHIEDIELLLASSAFFWDKCLEWPWLQHICHHCSPLRKWCPSSIPKNEFFNGTANPWNRLQWKYKIYTWTLDYPQFLVTCYRSDCG